jgi:hypothetical protein
LALLPCLFFGQSSFVQDMRNSLARSIPLLDDGSAQGQPNSVSSIVRRKLSAIRTSSVDEGNGDMTEAPSKDGF